MKDIALILLAAGLIMYVLGADPHHHGMEYFMGMFSGGSIALLFAARSKSRGTEK